MKQYRNSMQITGSILQVAQDGDRAGVPISTIIRKANLPYQRLNKFLDNLTGNGLMVKITEDNRHAFIITEKGIKYLDQYKKFADIAGSFGFELW